MKLLPENTVLTRQQLGLVVFSFILLMLAGVIGIAFEMTLSVQMAGFLLPTLAIIIIFVLFSMVLKFKVGDNLFGELGFLYLGLVVAYTVIPAFTFMFGSLNPGDPLALLLPAPSELAIHLWRHVLFAFGVATGYLLVRGRKIPKLITIKDPTGKNSHTIVFLIGIIAICNIILILMSAPVHSYYDNYTRYDHLPLFVHKFVSVCIRLKLGIYSVLITFLFLNYKKYKLMIPIIVTILCLYEIIYSFGSRIETLIILLETICLYHYTVKSITVKKGLVACVALLMLFSAVELLRTVEFNLNSAEEEVLQEGFKSASELNSVYLTGFHLYSERAQGVLPPTEWPMFFNDFISIVTFGDFTRWNPMEWYARNYYPDAVVAPFTLGPIADSAIWGGRWIYYCVA